MPLPESLRGVFFEFRWDTQRLWALTTPVTQLSTSTLWWHLDLPVWSTQPPRPLFDLAPRAVLADPAAFPIHAARIRGADVTFPLELFQNGDRWVIADGYHRLAQLFLANRSTAAVRLHSPDRVRSISIASPSRVAG
jgi:hypothetical protein